MTPPPGLEEASPVEARSDLPLTIWEHLGELRKRLIIALAGWLLCTAVAWAFSKQALDLLIRPPIDRLVYTQPTEPFFALCKVALVLGLIASIPLWLQQLYAFVSVGLEPEERRLFLTLIPPAYALFLLGAVVALKFFIPFSLQFLLSFSGPRLAPYITLGHYLGFVTNLCLGTGLLFELPLVMYILSALGIVSWRTFTQYRRHAFLGILILSALVTPTPDVFNQLVVALPTYALFELSILVARLTSRD